MSLWHWSSAVSAIFIGLQLNASIAVDGAIRAGAAKEVITPSLTEGRPVYIAGFGNNRTATAIHDDLYVRCIAISDGKTTLAIASADIIGLFYDPDVLTIRQRVRQQIGAVHAIIATTHNHNGPDTLGLWGPTPLQRGVDEDYLAFVHRQYVNAIVKAVRSMRPAHLRFASDNRPELANLQGDGRLPVVKDPMMSIMQAVDADTGKVIGTLIQWSNHPETLGGDNREITADYCGVLCKRLEAHFGGVAVYVNGAIGGMISPLDLTEPLIDPKSGEKVPRKSWDEMRVIGERAAAIAIDALSRAETVTDAEIKLHVKQIFIPLLNDRFRPLVTLGVLKRGVYTNGKPDHRIGKVKVKELGEVTGVLGEDLLTEVSVIEIANAQFVTIPGEIYPELVNGGYVRYPGADFPNAPFEPVIRQHMTAKYKFIIGLGNDEIGYIIPQCEWDDQPPWLNNAKDETYGEVNSTGYKASRVITEAIYQLLQRARTAIGR